LTGLASCTAASVLMSTVRVEARPISVKAVVNIFGIGFCAGMASGFGLAERIYADHKQKRLVRVAGVITMVAAAAAAVAVAVSSRRH
jgi:Zn-dependent protease